MANLCCVHLERLMRAVASTGLVINPSPFQHGKTEPSTALADPVQHAAIHYWYDINIPIYEALPAYVAHNGYKNPRGPPSATAFNWAKNYDGTLFSYWSERPQEEKEFGLVMKGYANHFTPWVDIYPTEELMAGGSTDEVVLVDVGGSFGHNIMKLQAKHSPGPGRLVLQDLPGVTKGAEVDGSVKVMAHDFMTPQPIKGMSVLG